MPTFLPPTRRPEFHRGAGPTAVADHAVALEQAPRHAEDEGQRQVGDVGGRDAGRVGHGDAARPGRRDIDAVHVAARAGDDLDLGKGIDEPLVCPDHGSRHQGADALGGGGEDRVGLVGVQVHVNREMLFQRREDLARFGADHQNFGLLRPNDAV